LKRGSMLDRASRDRASKFGDLFAVCRISVRRVASADG
jgi:hypothetical protein